MFSQIGLGATGDPTLSEQIGVCASKVLLSTGVFWNFAPVSDIARDTRWKRYCETHRDDSFLAGQMAATAKHFAGYSAPANGHDRAAAQIPIRQLAGRGAAVVPGAVRSR